MNYKYKKYQPIIIKWLDSVTENGWNRDDYFDNENSIEQETIGMFSRETKRTIQVYQSRGIDGSKLVNAMIQIPKCSIIKINILTNPKQ